MKNIFTAKAASSTEQAKANLYLEEMHEWMKTTVRESETSQQRAYESAANIVFTR